MTDNDELQEDSEHELDDVLDGISEKIADSLFSKVLRWFVRTTLGLLLFGVLWHYFDWAYWLFWGYVILASLSLVLTIYLHRKLVDRVGGFLSDTLQE